MTVRTYQHFSPKIHASAYIDDAATIIGKVFIGSSSSVWPNAVIRGDVNEIHIGSATNIQDGSILHCTHDGPYTTGGKPLIIGDNNTIGHLCMLHAATIKDFCLIGMSAIILDGAIIDSYNLIAAGSLVPPGKHLEGGYLWLGNPVKKIRKLTQDELDNLSYSAQHYVKLHKSYKI